MTKIHVSSAYTKAAITIAAVAGVLAVTLIAASPAHAACAPSGTPGGGSGNDSLCGTLEADTLFGQAGNDSLSGLAGNDTLDGGDGLDALDGGPGDDILIGGPGGLDTFAGGSGSDQLLARDGIADGKSSCGSGGIGSGKDLLDMDLEDFKLRPLVADCETITVGAVNEGPNVKISRRSVDVGEDGRAAVRLRCPASLTAPCAGKLRIGRTPKSEGKRTQYSIDQGEKKNVSARLSRRDRRKLRRREEITAVVTSVEQGQFGDKTTSQTIKIAQG